MGATKVGIREFRDNLAGYLLESEAPVAITRHGETVGYYIPACRKRSEKDTLREVSARMQEMLAAKGITEDDMIKDFKKWRKGGRK